MMSRVCQECGHARTTRATRRTPWHTIIGWPVCDDCWPATVDRLRGATRANASVTMLAAREAIRSNYYGGAS